MRIHTLILWLCLSLAAGAKPMMIDLVDIPIDRLLANTQAQIKAHPKDPFNYYVLGRIHALAYATSATSLQARKQDESLMIGFLGQGLAPPPTVEPPKDAKAAAKHLAAAQDAYSQALALDRLNLPARLGYAWCLQQAGRDRKALEHYRIVFNKAWIEQQSGREALFGRSLTEETGGYMLQLLDPDKDAREISEVRQTMDKSIQMPRSVTPIVIPLDESVGLESLIDPGSPVQFDLDGSGRRLAWGWLRPQGAWLVYLKRHRSVYSALQMMGSVSFYTFFPDGYAAMARLDDNADGWLREQELDGLQLWQDRNQDGLCQDDELLSLEQVGIVGLSTQAGVRSRGAIESPRGVEYRDGHRGPSYDWCPTALTR